MTKQESRKVIEVIDSLGTLDIRRYDKNLFYRVMNPEINCFKSWAKQVVAEGYETLAADSDRAHVCKTVRTVLPTFGAKLEVAAIVNMAISRI